MRFTKRIWDWSPGELRYARQLGLTHIIGHMPQDPSAADWDFLDFVQMKKYTEAFGLELAAIESPPPGVMEEILQAGPRRDWAIARFCSLVEDMGRAGIPVLGYHFSVLGNWGRWRQGLSGGGRGDAGVMSFDYDLVKDAPLTELGEVSEEEMWDRFRYFAERVMPAAEKAGVKLACHPDDPPVPVLRGIARILSSVDGLKRLVETVPSPSNGLTFCQGTVAEMGVDVLEATRYFLRYRKIFIVHFRNVRRLPGDGLKYDEVFIDEGDVDTAQAMRTYIEMGYDGLMDPDHAPVMEGDTQFGRHRGYAYSIGYMTALRKLLDRARGPEDQPR